MHECACETLYGPAPMTREQVRQMIERQDAGATRRQRPAPAESPTEGSPGIKAREEGPVCGDPEHRHIGDCSLYAREGDRTT